MRPMSKNNKYLILNNYNFYVWIFELENLCIREKAKKEIEKFLWLVNSFNKRVIMKHKTESITMNQQIGDKMENIVIKGDNRPFTWAIEVLRRSKLEANAVKEEDVFEKKEYEKDRLKALTISSCGYNLDQFYQRFDECAVAARSIGCELPDSYLMKIFAKGCAEHRDLKARAALVDLEQSNIQNYTDLKNMYA